MVLSRGKRSNAGKAPTRLDEAALNTPPLSTKPKTSEKASSGFREASIASQASKSSKKVAPPVKPLILSILPLTRWPNWHPKVVSIILGAKYNEDLGDIELFTIAVTMIMLKTGPFFTGMYIIACTASGAPS
jgi:hypothetical protein